MDYVNSFIQWFSSHPEILVGLGISSIFIFLLSILGISWFIANIPEDYFLASKRKPTKWHEQKPILRLTVIFIKNIIGLLLIIGGLLMLVLPGQGLLTIVTGLLLINYPGKYRLEKKIVNKPSIFRALNWIRIKANKPPLKRNTTHQSSKID
jgi:archaellum biogenesis protein FlaJ (TadC family)|tara:strand:+ start:3137 stop:3592 length:456 start_codon:yes stop_codon:yes gene_type:complete